MERCPTCRARVREATTCARCGTRLTRLLSIEDSARHHLESALRHLQTGEPELALKAIEHSLSLKREPLAQVLRRYLIDGETTPEQTSLATDRLGRSEPSDNPVPYLTNHP